MKLSTGCPPLDALLGGGLERDTMSLVYGEAGTGKTNLALQAARNAVLNDLGKVPYVDTEGVSHERLEQICGKNTPRVLKNILFSNPHDLTQQVRMVRALDKLRPKGLVVVDSLNMYYRLQLGHDGAEQPTHALIRMLGDLHRLARTREAAVLVTAQVYTDETGAPKPFGGRVMEHLVKTILLFERLGPGRRRATLVKHRSQPEGAASEFALTREGMVAP